MEKAYILAQLFDGTIVRDQALQLLMSQVILRLQAHISMSFWFPEMVAMVLDLRRLLLRAAAEAY